MLHALMSSALLTVTLYGLSVAASASTRSAWSGRASSTALHSLMEEVWTFPRSGEDNQIFLSWQYSDVFS